MSLVPGFEIGVWNAWIMTGLLFLFIMLSGVLPKDIGKRIAPGEEVKQVIDLSIGDNAKIIEGPFTGFSGVVDEINTEKSKLKLMISIFGRSTPVELEFFQVEKQ